ncbi:ARM repeat-containing protein [Hypoxylon fragiforme]|uniref:ARM repeat-containing protein n=1 Tax=Hypoxylon fragiforme TaxID=63214 RepID=UPI0020C6CC96|nr:ARM repeat-containing protein [Hypoxylon fragiforme]KAI2606347.1 ARM repeat-containing protein [Hypoxylon fragiforme]
MNFLKSAVASAIAQGPPFPYTFGDKVSGDSDASIWTLYNGTRHSNGSDCSIFSFNITANSRLLPLAKNAVKKLRTMRHPGVISVLDIVETDTYIYIATEKVVPLRWQIKRKVLNTETIKWGLYSIARTVKFINDEGSSIHGNLNVGSIYTSESGEWKLGGFEVLSNVKDEEAIIYRFGSLMPDPRTYSPPEVERSGWDIVKKGPHSAVDAYNFGTTMFEIFNGSFMPDQAGQTKGIPPNVHVSYKRLVHKDPKARITVGTFLEQGRRSGGFFDSPIIRLTEGIDNLGVIGIKSESERQEFLDQLEQHTDDYPEEFFKVKVLPELLKSVEFGGGGPKAFSLIMKISKKLTDEDFQLRVQPMVVKLFGNPDRAIRVCLLDNLPIMIDRLPQKMVNDKIFPNLVSGFTDVAPVVREQTLKSILVIIAKLSDRTINGELIRHLAKTANDEQPGIRTNTTICLGKIAKNLSASTRAKVLTAAFTRSLRDPFVHARNAALLALAATLDHFSDDECATRILPAICPSLLDKEKLVRDQANKTMEVYLQKIRKAATSMPDTVQPPPQTTEAPGPRMSTPQASEASSWAGWAISSFTNKLSAASGEMQTSANYVSPFPSSKPTSPPSTGLNPPQRTVSSSSSTPQVSTPAWNPPPAETYFKDPEPTENDGDAWGDMGDMDDDGNAFFDAPAERTKSSQKEPVASPPTPFDDSSEPDFAGWLAAQAQKKTGPGGGKPLPKGLAKSNGRSTPTSKKPLPARPAPKPVAPKKIDTKPKETDDDDGWGDGW